MSLVNIILMVYGYPKNMKELCNNGFHLDFADDSNPGNDVSSNNNDWTESGFNTADVNEYLTDFTRTTGSFVTDKGLAFDGDTSTRCFGDANGTFKFTTRSCNSI